MYQPDEQKKAVAYIEIEFMALALGPKLCDLEVRCLKTSKPIGRIQLELDIKQYQNMEVNLMDMDCTIFGKEDRPLYSQFKVITNNDVPKFSEPTKTVIGGYLKNENETNFKWLHKIEDLLSSI